jgi:hypothetical protein
MKAVPSRNVRSVSLTRISLRAIKVHRPFDHEASATVAPLEPVSSAGDGDVPGDAGVSFTR